MSNNPHEQDYESSAIRTLRNDLALALRAAAHHGLSEGVCNHFSVEIPDGSGRFLLNPQGLLWHEILNSFTFFLIIRRTTFIGIL